MPQDAPANPPDSRFWVAEVAVEARSGGSGAVYTYRATADTHEGDAVFVTLGNRPVLGYVVSVRQTDGTDLGFPVEGLKPIVDRVAGLSIPPQTIGLVKHTAREYLCPIPVALAAALPPGANVRLVTAWSLTGNPDDTPLPMNAAEREAWKALSESGGQVVASKTKRLDPLVMRGLKSLRGRGLVAASLEVAEVAPSKRVARTYRLSPDTDRLDRFLRDEGRRKPTQAMVLLTLRDSDSQSLTFGDIRGLCIVTDKTLKAMVDEGLLEPVFDSRPVPAKPTPVPNEHQRAAIDAVAEAVRSRKPVGFLLYGVTGSGKTEVYLRLAAEALSVGRQVLYLVPEIALAAQAIGQLRERFGQGVAVLHSELTPRQRLDNWLSIRSGRSAVVVGARSALFAPLNDLGLIVVDEEHEASYKQESAPRYHAKRLVQYLSERHTCPVVYGSATPSVETYRDAALGLLHRLDLPTRTATATLPTVTVENLSDGYKRGKPSILSAVLAERLGETLSRGEQAILFLNRRAYAPFLVCRDCGKTFRCLNCATSLAYSQRERLLRCHHCDHRETPPDVCPKCGGTRLRPFGVGTEKVEEFVAQNFPEARVARLDRDVTKRRGALEETLAAFSSGEIDVLVGTQIVAKGLNFPGVTLVGVIAADISLNVPDFRSSERTFQLLSQVAGRAGRGDRPGTVVIQTFNPEHMAVVAAQNHDYQSFFAHVANERKEAGYPPFRRVVNVLVTGEDRPSVLVASVEAARRLRKVPDATVLGPADCPIERIQQRWRRHVLVKLPPEAPVGPIGEALAGYSPKKVNIVADVDPFSLM